jgi:hypothetical protein
MILFTTADTEKDLRGILSLQRVNLPGLLSPDEIRSQGFVTVSHSFEDLKKLNEIEKHIVAKDEDKVIAYLLAMTARSKNSIPILFPMFEIFDKVLFRAKLISHYNYIVVGQVCVAKDYRGKGILNEAYNQYKVQFGHKYDFAITEIAITNPRSIKAHKKIGFNEIHKYKDPNEIEWVIVLWDWT